MKSEFRAPLKNAMNEFIARRVHTRKNTKMSRSSSRDTFQGSISEVVLPSETISVNLSSSQEVKKSKMQKYLNQKVKKVANPPQQSLKY